MDNITSLQVTDNKVGNGATATAGKQVTVHYTGWLYDAKAADKHGKKFDSSRDHGEPFSFKLGARQVISGWDQGVAGMKVGGARTLVIPAELGYGSRRARGESERVLGRALHDLAPREQVVIATKAFYPVAEHPNGSGLSRKHLMHAI